VFDASKVQTVHEVAGICVVEMQGKGGSVLKKRRHYKRDKY
jgi:hypothetical protein